MRVLLDTSAYSGFMKGQVGIQQALQRADEVCLSAIVLGELLAGFRRGKHRARNEQELQRFLSSPRSRLLAIEEATAERYASIRETLGRSGTPIPTNDIWIAATAMQHGLRLLTTDAHYQKVQQVLVELFPVS